MTTSGSHRLPAIDRMSALVVVLLWGLNFVAGKVALAALPPFLIMAIRFTAVGLLLAPFFRPRLAQIPGLTLVALVLGIGHFSLLFVGLAQADAASAAVVIQLGVPFSVLLSWIVFGDRPDGKQMVGMALAFAGVALLAGDPGRPRLWPLLIIVFSIFLWAVSNILIKRLARTPALTLNGWVSLLAAPMALVISAVFEHDQIPAMAAAGWQAWAGVGFTILGSSVVAYTLWYGLLARYPVSRVVPYTLLGPVIGFAAGVMVLGETVTLFKIIGGLLTVAGVAIIELGPAATPQPDSPA